MNTHLTVSISYASERQFVYNNSHWQALSIVIPIATWTIIDELCLIDVLLYIICIHNMYECITYINVSHTITFYDGFSFTVSNDKFVWNFYWVSASMPSHFKSWHKHFRNRVWWSRNLYSYLFLMQFTQVHKCDLRSSIKIEVYYWLLHWHVCVDTWSR